MPRSWASLLRSTVVRDTALNSGPILSFSLDNLAPSCPDGGLTGGSPRQRRSAAKEFTSRATPPRTQHTLVGLYYHSLWGFLLIRRGALRDAAPPGEPFAAFSLWRPSSMFDSCVRDVHALVSSPPANSLPYPAFGLVGGRKMLILCCEGLSQNGRMKTNI